jgi:hypothetical protein
MLAVGFVVRCDLRLCLGGAEGNAVEGKELRLMTLNPAFPIRASRDGP